MGEFGTPERFRGKKLNEGKTKVIFELPTDPRKVIVFSKNDITAGDGAKHDVIFRKGEYATRTTSNVFEFLNSNGVATSFIERTNGTSFEAYRCEMIPLEVVTRRYAYGSFLKRNPHVEEKTEFSFPPVEFYLKTNNKQWERESIPVDDPLIRIVDRESEEEFELLHPAKPILGQDPFLKIDQSDVVPKFVLLEEIEGIARQVFWLLETEWKKHGCTLIDMKIEFGIGPDGNLLVSDVIDNDSWRLMIGEEHLDKQVYRNGGDLREVANKYSLVADLTDAFTKA